jgi:hypothetical protein
VIASIAVAESFLGTLQLELLDEHRWESCQQLANAVFGWIERWYNPWKRHSYCKMLSLADIEAQAAMIGSLNCPRNRGKLRIHWLSALTMNVNENDRLWRSATGEF